MTRHIVRWLGMAALAWAFHAAVAFAQMEMRPDEGAMTHPASMVDCAPCVSCYVAVPGGRLATGDGSMQEVRVSLKFS